MACGDVVKQNPGDADTVVVDADDVTVPDGLAAGVVTVHVLNRTGDGAPDASATVVIADAAGTLVADGLVDSAGRFVAEGVTGPVTVTAIRYTTNGPTEVSADLTSVVGVLPGEDITIGLKRRPTVLNQGGQSSMNVSFVPFAGAALAYAFATDCQAIATTTTSSPVGLTFFDSCRQPTFDLLAVSSTTGQYLARQNVAFMAGGTTAAGGFSPMANFSITASNTPVGFSRISATRRTVLEHTAVLPTTVAVTNPPTGAGTYTVMYPPLPWARTEVTLGLSSVDSDTFQQLEARTGAAVSNLALDLGALTLPFIDGFIPTATGITWLVTVPGGEGDGMIALWRGGWTASKTVAVNWTLIQPTSTTGLTLPRLPSTYAELDPSAQAATVTPAQGCSATMFDYDRLDGYGAYRLAGQTYSASMLDAATEFGLTAFTRRVSDRTDRSQ